MIYIDDTEPEGELEPAFPYRDVTIKRGVDAHQLYDILSEVGRGKFGTVYKCQEKSSGLRLAAKFVPIPKREDKRNVEREVEIMNSLQHHLIIQLYAAFEYQKMMCVMLELIEGGELFDRVVDDEFVLTERVCVVIIRQVCQAMEFIHRNNILHLDLKPENILCLTQEGNRIKVIDFGLARKFDPDKRLQILFGTPEFVAPEVVNFDCISYGTDMWSVGVICYVLISGLSPFMGETDIETMANVTIAKYDFEDECFSNVSPECLDFISKLLVKDLSIRMTATKCLEHKWLQRRPKAPPVVTPKPLNVPPPKLKAATPSPILQELDNNVNEDDANSSVNILEEEDHEGLETKDMNSTKDNLKNFIERWEEHPNSPYVFDVDANVIAPLSETPYNKTHGPDSITSSRVCSPSPCESIATVTEEDATNVFDIDNDADNDTSPSTIATPVNESREKLFPSTSIGSGSGTLTPTSTTVQYAPQHLFSNRFDEFGGSSTNLQTRSMKSYLHTFDRRNSDTNYLIGRRSSGERVNLAEEIRKLSDHLLMLANINTKLGNESQELASDKNNNTSTKENSANNSSTSSTVVKKSKTKKDSPKDDTTKVTKTTSSKTKTSTAKNKVKTETITTISESSDAVTSTTETNTSSSFTTNASTSKPKTKVSSLSVRLQQSIEETPKLTNGGLAPWAKTTRKSSTTKTITVGANSSKLTTSMSTAKNLEESANNKRAKFRINQMSRDVPIGLPDTHQTVNLEEAANTTKDCLLHLLEKYNETKTRNPLGRHQSISVDWNVSDNLEYRSMSSINAFFQRQVNTGENVRSLQAQLTGKAAGKSGDTAGS